MYIYEKTIRVRYGETDQMGYVHHGNYPLYYEEGRTEMMRSMGLNYREMEEKGILLPVYSISIRYIEPARFDDILRLRVIIKELPTAKIRFFYELYNEQDKLINTAETILVFVDSQTRKPRRPPEAFMKKLNLIFND